MSIEAAIYLALKRHLTENDWTILGGQPPSGTDHYPVIEIRDPANRDKGSKSSMKPDLVAYRDRQIAVIEIKPQFSRADYQKLLDLKNSPDRLDLFWYELQSRNISSHGGELLWEIRESLELIFCLAYRRPLENVPEIWTFLADGDSFELHPPSYP